MAEPEKRKRRVRRARKPVDPKPVLPVTSENEELEIEEVEIGEAEVEVVEHVEKPKEPIVETIPAKKEVPVEERGRIVIQDDVLMDIVEKIVDRGKAVVISKGKDNRFLIHAEDESEFAIGRSSTWLEYHKEVLTSEYFEWTTKWDGMSKEERIEFAEEMNAEWEHHKTPRINSMRLAQAVREKLNIEKYKEQYNTRSARGRIKPRR